MNSIAEDRSAMAVRWEEEQQKVCKCGDLLKEEIHISEFTSFCLQMLQRDSARSAKESEVSRAEHFKA